MRGDDCILHVSRDRLDECSGYFWTGRRIVAPLSGQLQHSSSWVAGPCLFDVCQHEGQKKKKRNWEDVGLMRSLKSSQVFVLFDMLFLFDLLSSSLMASPLHSTSSHWLLCVPIFIESKRLWNRTECMASGTPEPLLLPTFRTSATTRTTTTTVKKR